MAEVSRSRDPATDLPSENHDGAVALLIALVIAAAAMLGPLLFFDTAWREYVTEHGGIREGAAATGAGFAFAFAAALRTVSRTVLRTLTRTTARAGLKVTLKSLARSAVRTGGRSIATSVSAHVAGRADGPQPPKDEDTGSGNIKSLLFASALLFVSWVVVVGVGQPFDGLLDREQSIAQMETAAAELAEEQARLARVLDFEGLAWNAMERVRFARGRLDAARATGVDAEITEASAELTEANAVLAEALVKSGGRIAQPAAEMAAAALPQVAQPGFFQRLFTYAPFKGATPWSSPVLWGGGLVMVLPLWLIYGVQAFVARRRGVVLQHATAIDGGLLQLYFAGAMSFMPLTSDVFVGGTDEDRGRVAIASLLFPTLFGCALWTVWKVTGEGSPWVLFAADAFLLYPMVQVFPLQPLDGFDLWEWSRARWFGVFVAVLVAFVFLGSEGLKHVI